MGLLWPESGEDAARNLLNQAVHVLRKAVGRRTILTTGDELRLDPDRVECDLIDFRRALEEGRPDRAMKAYGGEFLEGLFLPESAAFERWAEEERIRVRGDAGQALERLAREREAAGDHVKAVGLWRRRLKLAPHAGRVVRRLMRALAAAGDRGTALREAERHARRLRRELEAEPDPEVQALADALRRGPAASDGPAAPSTRAVPGPTETSVGGTEDGRSAVDVRGREVPSRPGATGPGERPFVGRREERERLREAWRTAARDGVGFALVAGEAGIGKTRLAEELVAWAARRGVVTAEARSYPAEGRLAFGPAAQWLRTDAIRAGAESLEAAARAELAPLAPELAGRRAEGERPDHEGRYRQRFFRALARAVLGRGRPRLFLLDDLQWCDRDTLQWLHYLLRFDPAAPFLALGTMRVEEVGPDHPAEELLRALRREEDVTLTEIEVGTLGPEATAELGASVAGRELGEAEVARLVRETEGHPLFIVEGVQAGLLARPEDHQPESAPIPDRVRAVIRDRLALLSPRAGEVARVAATVGREFGSDVVIRASGLDAEAVADALDELVERRLIRSARERLDFTHDKLREVIYGDLPPYRRRLLHGNVARALEEEHDGDLDVIAGAVAIHHERAGSSERALALYRQAARRARVSHSYEEAVGYLARALDLLELMPEGSGQGSGAALELELQRELGDALLRTRGWAAPEVFAAHRRQLELSEALGDSEARCLALWGLQSVRMVRAEVDEARALGERLLEESGRQENPLFEAAGRFVVGFAHLLAGNFEAARVQLERGIEGMEPESSWDRGPFLRQDVGILLLCGASHAAWFLDRDELALDRARDASSLAERLGQPFARTAALTYAGVLHQLRDEPDLARERCEGAVALGEEFGISHYLHTAQIVRGWVVGMEGRAREGLREIRSALGAYEGIGSRLRLPYFLGLEADLHARLGDVERARDRIERALSLCEATGERWCEEELAIRRKALGRDAG